MAVGRNWGSGTEWAREGRGDWPPPADMYPPSSTSQVGPPLAMTRAGTHRRSSFMKLCRARRLLVSPPDQYDSHFISPRYVLASIKSIVRANNAPDWLVRPPPTASLSAPGQGAENMSWRLHVEAWQFGKVSTSSLLHEESTHGLTVAAVSLLSFPLRDPILMPARHISST